MFDFERLELYQVARRQNKAVLQLIFSDQVMDTYLKDQWKRASISMVLNLTEGAGRINDTDKKHFFTLARGSVYECTALLQLLHDLEKIDTPTYQGLYDTYEQISKMLLGMYRSKN
jgi:four helix bundle protein